MESKEIVGRVKISGECPEGGRILSRQMCLEIDGMKMTRYSRLKLEYGAHQIPLVTVSFYPVQIELDAAAISVFGYMEFDDRPRERKDITPREWEAWEWAYVQRGEDAEPMYIRVKPKGAE